MNVLLAQTAASAEAVNNGFLTSLIQDFSSEQRFVVCLVLIGCLTAIVISIVSIISGVCFHLRKGERETELVRDLLSQGRSADEIEKIVRPADGWSRAWGSCWKGK